jgi:hypothetical protein
VSTSRRARLAVATTAAALTVVLTGCGVSGTGFQPGVAAQVDDRTVTTDRVDDIVGLYCGALEEQLATDGSVVPLSYFRGGVAGQLALVLAAEQLADDYGVEPTTDYDRAVSGIESQTTELPDDQREAVVEVETAGAYIGSVQLAVGQVLLAEEGVAEPTSEEAGQRGLGAYNEWLDAHEVTFNPEYGVTIKDGSLVAVDTQLSYPVGEAAKAGQADEPDPDYSGALPESQRCG